MGIYSDDLDLSSDEEQEKKEAGEAPKKEQPPEESILDELLKKKGFKSPDDFAKSYEELEKELTKRGKEGTARDKELEESKAQLTQAMQYIQSIQNPKKEIEIDPDIDEALTPEGRKAIERLLKKHFEAEGQALGQALQKVLGEIRESQSKHDREIEGLKIARYYDKQAEKLAKDHKEDFDDLREDIANVFDQFPDLADPAKHPNGMEEAYKYVKAKKLLKDEEEKASSLEKEAARLPGGSARRLSKEQTPEEKYLEKLFGDDKKPGGIYG